MSLLLHPELEKTKITKEGQIHVHFNAREKCEKSSKNKSIPSREVKHIFMICESLNLFPVKCEMASFFLLNSDFDSSIEPFVQNNFLMCEIRNKHELLF